MNQQWIIDDYKRRLPDILNGTDTGPDGFLQQRASVRNIIEATARAFNVEEAQILGRSQFPSVVAARWTAMWIMDKHLGLSSVRIGAWLKKDHTTVLRALEQFDQRVLANPEYKSNLRQVLRTVGLK